MVLATTTAGPGSMATFSRSGAGTVNLAYATAGAPAPILDPPPPPPIPGPGPQLMFFAKRAEPLPANTESLGTQSIAGIMSEGSRITSTIETGAIGNDRPIQIVTERWYAAELQTAVKTSHSDPQTGVETFELTNVSRTDPAPALFQVPAGYQFVDGK
jgi:hypothetical protein